MHSFVGCGMNSVALSERIRNEGLVQQTGQSSVNEYGTINAQHSSYLNKLFTNSHICGLMSYIRNSYCDGFKAA